MDASIEQMDSLERIQVEGLPLNNSSVIYYYVYSSMLAAFGLCDQAGPIMDQLEATYSSDPTIMGIMDENRQVCRIFAEKESGN